MFQAKSLLNKQHTRNQQVGCFLLSMFSFFPVQVSIFEKEEVGRGDCLMNNLLLGNQET